MSFKDKESGRINPAFVAGEEEAGNPPSGGVIDGTLSVNPSTPRMNYEPKESRRMLKNIFLTSFAFAFLFTAFQSMAALQSSLNSVSKFKLL